MVTKPQSKSAKKAKLKVGKLKLKEETVKNLSTSDKKEIKGGFGQRNVYSAPPGANYIC